MARSAAIGWFLMVLLDRGRLGVPLSGCLGLGVGLGHGQGDDRPAQFVQVRRVTPD
jgi:hypothetical protein